MNPFDIKAVLLAKHAQHVVLVHFPIALFLVGVGFDLVAQWTKNRTLAVAAYYNLAGAAIASVPVLITGVLAWQFALGGAKLKGILLMHLVLACVASLLMWVTGWMHFRANRRPDRRLPGYRVPIELVAVALVGLTAHLGGFLSGVNIPN